MSDKQYWGKKRGIKIKNKRNHMKNVNTEYR